MGVTCPAVRLSQMGGPWVPSRPTLEEQSHREVLLEETQKAFLEIKWTRPEGNGFHEQEEEIVPNLHYLVRFGPYKQKIDRSKRKMIKPIVILEDFSKKQNFSKDIKDLNGMINKIQGNYI